MLLKNIQSLVDAYCKKDFQFITQFIKSSPKNVNTESSLAMMTSQDPYYTICALDGMAAAYTHGSNYDYAILFGIADYECVQYYFFKSDYNRKDEILYYATSSSYLVTKSYLDTAEHNEGLQFYEKTKSAFGNYFNNPDFTSLHLNAVELYLGIDNPETARKIFQTISPDNIPYYSKIYYDRLSSKIKSLFREISVIPEEAKKAEAEAKQADVQAMIDIWRNTLSQTEGTEAEESKKIIAMMDELQTSIGFTEDDDNKTFENATRIYSRLNDYMASIGGGRQELNLIELRKELQDYQAVILNNATAFDQEALQNTLKGLQQLLTKLDDKYIDESNNTLWSIQICQKRLNLFAEGAATLEQLRKNLEQKRLQISNKKERAGAFKSFLYLFPNLVEFYYKSENAKGVIKAIEASKGRLLADAIAGQTNSDAQIDNYELPVNKLPALLLKNKANYLSFFMDEEYSVSALVTSKGNFYAGYIPVGKTIIHQWVDDHLDDPKEWEGKGVKGLFSKKTNIPKLLEQFVNILNIAIQDGNINPGDHLVYSPDDMLFLFPLQYVMFNNKYLIEQFSLSKIHGAYQLVHILEQTSLHRNVICFTVPAVQDLNDPEKISQFSKVRSWLEKNLPDKNIISGEDTINELLSADYINSIIHFSTHGVFPSPGMEPAKANPYYNSGLLLKNDDKLPELDSDFNYYTQNYFLNPQKLFEFSKSWQSNHITFQACVSARSKEGVGGDALGMESAAFFCGATSMLTAGWNISIDWANKFCILFYNYWLLEKLSKAEAYKKTMLDLLKAEIPSDYPAPYYWAGMTLSGDWR